MIWYPYTQMKTMKTPIKVHGAKGIYLHTDKGLLIDTTSSWWSVIHGYNNEEINKVLKDQVSQFSHVMLGGLCHDPVIKLSQKLADMLPGDLNYCFYSDSGSVAVEVALKMAIQYFVNKGEKKDEIIALKKAYHGDTFKTMAIGDDPDYHHAFPNKEGVYHIDLEDDLEAFIKANHTTIAAMIVEPLLQGAGGMIIYHVDFLKRARDLCSRCNIILIFDEVATGFGRTGHRFVSDLVQPDIIVLGKALTAGYLGHAVTVASEKIYQGFYSDNPDHALMHGPTFMGNALACRVALKSIEIFERDNYIDKIKAIESTLKREFSDFKDGRIRDIRILGGCLCIETYSPSDLEGFKEFALNNGIHARPFLKYMYGMFPYIIDEGSLLKVCQVYKAWFERS